MSEYPSMSHKSRELQKQEDSPERRARKVISGSAKTRKKSGLSKFTDMMISEDATNVKSYIFMDVLIPAFKKAISDIVTNGIDMILYGETGRNKKKSTTSKISYRSFYERDNDRPREREYSRSHSAFDYDEIIFDTRGDAQACLYEMENILEKYTYVSVGDLYDIAEISVPNHIVNNYGWTSLRNASVARVRDGYTIKLPKAMPL